MPAPSASEVADHSPIVVAGSDGLWDNFVGSSPVDVAETTQAISAKLESTVNDFFQETGSPLPSYSLPPSPSRTVAGAQG